MQFLDTLQALWNVYNEWIINRVDYGHHILHMQLRMIFIAETLRWKATERIHTVVF
jgi:hypothetical protein